MDFWKIWKLLIKHNYLNLGAFWLAYMRTLRFQPQYATGDHGFVPCDVPDPESGWVPSLVCRGHILKATVGTPVRDGELLGFTIVAVQQTLRGQKRTASYCMLVRFPFANNVAIISREGRVSSPDPFRKRAKGILMIPDL